ncbi:MAG TPA: nicotinamide-nucleotide amidohydrolase family protein [Catalimonadaceae bacterium]|mgnify:FL=1|nr:nicotinamide-nucleotide amidohydrolase family protein [Catalimonadaceae bacterium]HPI09507.1 nicotinamide-nucleotide amidohydrolase family protein [Catalimonadaceae bacterium]
MTESETLRFHNLLKERNLHIAFAESITAGLLAATVASVPGASAILKGGVVTYDKALKISLLGVKKETLDAFGAESKQTTLEMAYGLAKRIPEAELVLSITGSASPSVNAYQISAPAGSVFVCVGMGGTYQSFNTVLSGSRTEVLEEAVRFAMGCVEEFLK